LAAAEALVVALVEDFLVTVGMEGEDRTERTDKMGGGQEEAQRALVHPREPVTWRREMRTDVVLFRLIRQTSRAIQSTERTQVCVPESPVGL